MRVDFGYWVHRVLATSSPCWLSSKHEVTRIEVLCTWLFRRQDVPTLYWRSQGVEAFDGKWYTLYGPLSRGPVKTATHLSLKQRFCSFTKGFAGFCEANGLKLGDELQFTKVGLLEYDVRKV